MMIEIKNNMKIQCKNMDLYSTLNLIDMFNSNKYPLEYCNTLIEYISRIEDHIPLKVIKTKLNKLYNQDYITIDSDLTAKGKFYICLIMLGKQYAIF